MAVATEMEGADSITFKWTGETGTGSAVFASRYADKTVVHNGTGTLEMEGSADGTNWFTLNDNAGTPVTGIATNTPIVLLENPPLIRPVVTGGTTTVVVTGK